MAPGSGSNGRCYTRAARIYGANMITRRRILAGAGGITALVATTATAQVSNVAIQARKGPNADHTEWVAAVRERTGGVLHWRGARRPAVSDGRSGARVRRTCHVRAGRAH